MENEKENYTYSALTAIEREMIREIIADPSIKDIKLSEKLGISRNTIAKYKKRELFQDALKVFQRKPLDLLIDAQTDACLRLHQIILTGDDNVACKACRNILYGLGTLKTNLDLTFDPEKFKKQKENIKQIAKEHIDKVNGIE